MILHSIHVQKTPPSSSAGSIRSANEGRTLFGSASTAIGISGSTQLRKQILRSLSFLLAAISFFLVRWRTIGHMI